MYQLVVEHIDSEIDDLGIFDEIYGLAEQATEITEEDVRFYPVTYEKDGNEIPIDFNNAQSKLYVRRNGESTIEEKPVEEHDIGCIDPIIVNTPMRYVGMVIRCYEDNAYRHEKIVHDIMTKIYDADIRSVMDQTKFEEIILTVGSYDVNSLRVWQEEFQGYEFKLGFDKILFRVDFNINVELERTCYLQNYCYCG